MSIKKWIDERYPEPNIYRWIGFILEAISASVLFFLMMLTCVDVTGRYLFNNSVNGAFELTQIGLAILVFAQMPLITWRGNHVVVDLLDNFLGGRIVKLLGIFSVFVVSSAFYFLAHRIYELAERSIRRGEVTEYLKIPTGYLTEYIAIMSWLTAACMLTYGAYRVLKGEHQSQQLGD
ncbi:MAG: TRAP transporter small permease [Marinomonas hwangdonensis]|nr:TRAP transporter small permease [Marinomonas hwangdonensis]